MDLDEAIAADADEDNMEEPESDDGSSSDSSSNDSALDALEAAVEKVGY